MNTQATALDSIKSDIIERLNDYKGGTYYGCDLAYTLFEGENANGSVFCNTYKTVEFIKANFELFGELVEYYQDNFSETLNPFTEPEKAHVILLLEASQSILSKCDFIERNWNEKFELTKTAIEEITEQVNDFDGDLF
jgi:uncharacterized protein YjbI with pentapeptide repeats